MNIEIRRATEEDIDDLVHVFNDSLEYKRSLGDNTWGEDQFHEDELRAIMARGDTYAGLVDETAVASMSLEWSDKRVWGAKLGDDNNAAYIHKLAVKQNLRGRHLGEELIAWAGDLARSKGKSYLRLDCNKENSGLIDYYSRLGFNQVGKAMLEEDNYQATLMQKLIGVTDEI